ncbi:hypothetical protein BJ912DRAFT_835625, partial [Pholiota molesta]
GMTQYLANVQGMPRAIEKRLDKICNAFKWDNEGRATINAQTMSAPIEFGGKKILNITERNDAIALVWVRDYLKHTSQRPTWAFFMDEILAKNAKPSPVVPLAARINTFLQSWAPTQKKLPKIIQKMLAVSKKYNIAIDTPELSETQAGEVPIWFHL